MKSRILKSMSAMALAGTLLFTGWGPELRAAGRNELLSGSIYGVFDYAQGAWVGNAILRFGDGAPMKATFVDRNTSFNMAKNGAIDGTETITVKFADNSGTFEILAWFRGTPGEAPNLYTLHEIGRIANGTGKYKNLSGHVVVKGPFMLPDPEGTPGAPPWIAEMHGAVEGLE